MIIFPGHLAIELEQLSDLQDHAHACEANHLLSNKPYGFLCSYIFGQPGPSSKHHALGIKDDMPISVCGSYSSLGPPSLAETRYTYA
jgi:hypothetical protein